MQKRPSVLRNNQGTSFVEVLVSLAVVALMAVMVFPFFANQRKTIANYEPTGLCQGYLARAAARLSSGGDFATEAPEFSNFAVSLPTRNDWKNVPDIFVAPDAKPVSFNPANTRTFSDRFTEMGVPSIAGRHRLYVTRLGITNYKRLDGTVIPAEADGVLLYTPLLIKGAVADIADLYNKPEFHGTFSPVPAYIQGNEGNFDPRYTADIQMQVDRIRVSDKSVKQTSKKFWPIPRNEFGNTDPEDKDKYRITTPEDFLAQEQGLRYFAVAQIPQPDDGIEMSWDYGFKVSFKGRLTEIATGNVIDCNNSQDYFLPTDFHNVVSYQSDFDFLTPPSSSTTVPQTTLASELSNKFYDTAPLLSVAKAPAAAITTTYNSMVADPTFLAIFAGTNFGTDALGQPNSRFGNKRPECSQDGLKSKTFELRLRFKNLNKEPGAIPLCMDTSTRPGVTTADKSDYIYCPTALGARTRIKNDFLPSQTGFVPCEKMRFCGQTPEVVRVTTANGNIEYRYQYTIRNDNNDSGNYLWGCDIAYTTAIVDPSGNLSYIPADLTMSDNSVKKLGYKRPFLGSVTPKIHFKPPPCYSCKCKPGKGGKNFFKVLLVFTAFVGAIFLAAPFLGTAVFDIAGLSGSLAPGFFSGGLVGALGAGVTGIALTAVATCMFQATGMTGGACSPSDGKDQGGDYQSCRSADKTPDACAHGYTCNNLGSPQSTLWTSDLPPGIKDKTALGYCSYETETHTSVNPITHESTTWIVQKGGRIGDTGPFDTSAVLNFSDPNVSLNPGSAYVPIDGISTYSMIDLDAGKYCYIQHKCVWNGSHGTWVINSGAIDGASANYDACWNIKTGYALDFHTDGKVTKGGASCLKVETDPDEMRLQPCSFFDIACHDGSNHFSLGALTLNLGGYTNIAGHATGHAASAVSTPMGMMTPVQKTAAQCSKPTVECGTSPCPAPPVSGLYSPGDGHTYERNDSCPADPTPATTSYTKLICDSSCHANDSSFGTCTWDTSSDPPICNQSPVYFYQRTFYKFDNWLECQLPPGPAYHMRTPTSGMLCFEGFSGTNSTLPLCSEGSSGIGGTADMTCPGGTHCL
jgi:hypothetical protein